VQLHKRDVVDAATTLLDSYGIADLTMRRLAKELSVSPGALYWHFANKQQLLGAVADRILESLDDVAGGWRDRVAGTCTRLRDALLSHTDGAELVSASFAAGQSQAMAQILARLTDAAAEAGVNRTHAELAARTVVYYVLGFTADEQSDCSGTPQAPICRTASLSFPRIPAPGSPSDFDCLSTASRRTGRHCMPFVTTASSAVSDADCPEVCTAPPRVHAHSARSPTGPLTVAVGSPAVARTARGLSSARPTSTNQRRSTSVATNSTTAFA